MRKPLILVGSIILVLLFATLINFSTIQPVKAQQNFSDNFDSGNANGWTQQMGYWFVNNGEYCVSVGTVENGISTVNGLSLSECAITTQLTFTDTVGFRAGIIFRYLDSSHYYSLELSNEYNKIDLVKYSPSDPAYGTIIAENTTVINSYMAYQLRLEAVGSNFTAYLNGQKVLSGNDNSYTSGLIGLRARGADVNFDNFAASADLQSLPSPTPNPTIQPQNVTQYPNTFSDDFSTDTGAWQYLGSAYRDTTNQYLVLTNNDNNIAGAAFFSAPIQGPFTASFSYKAGGGSYNGDGFTMFFYKQHYSSLANGGDLAFNTPISSVPGYGIEFDGWQNIPQDFQPAAGSSAQGDPSSAYIGLLQNSAGNHLAYTSPDQRVDDNIWHQATVVVGVSSVDVYVDQGLVLQWAGELNRTYAGFGFSGANGGVGDDWHIIDNFSISAQNMKTPTLTTSCISSVAQSSLSVQINGGLTYKGVGIAGAPVLLSYSVTGGQSWQDLTLVDTSSNGNYSALWFPSVTGNYLLKAVYQGDNNYLGATNQVNFAMEPCTNQSIFSINSNSTITELFFDSTNKVLSFDVSGPSGTTGYADIYIPKSLMSDIVGLNISLDNNPIQYTVQSISDSWLLHLTYHHSTHRVMVDLGSNVEYPLTSTSSNSVASASPSSPIPSSTPTPSPVVTSTPTHMIVQYVPTWFYAIVIGLTVAIAVSLATIASMRKRFKARAP